MILTTLLAIATLHQSPAQTLVDIHDLTPREHRTAGFVLATAQQLRVAAVGADPRPERRARDRAKDSWQDDDRATWPAAAWIVDARTRQVVWDLRAAETEREGNGLRHFAGTVRLPAGVYEAHYASYAAAWTSMDGVSVINGLRELAGRIRYGGPYVEDGSYKQFSLLVAGIGRAARESEIDLATQQFTRAAIARIAPEPGATARYGFALARPTDVEVYAIGEIRRDAGFDYGWIINADTRARVWQMEYANTEPAGGAAKNRMTRETLRLPAGRYVAYFVSDDSHASNPLPMSRSRRARPSSRSPASAIARCVRRGSRCAGRWTCACTPWVKA